MAKSTILSFWWAASVLLLSCPVAAIAAPLSFAATFPRPDGGTRTVAFSGKLAGTQVSGQVSIDGQQLSVVATVASGTAAGKFEAPDGRQVGTFSARVVGSELEGSHDMSGEVGSWSIPLSKLPQSIRNVLQ